MNRWLPTLDASVADGLTQPSVERGSAHGSQALDIRELDTPPPDLPLPSEAPHPIGRRYKILQWLGSGGMGAVYRALDTELNEEVALKMLRRGLSASAIERFRREVRLARRVVHRNVARMFDIGEDDGQKFLTMQLIDGVSLAHHARTRTLEWSELIAIAEDICAGLGAAHAAGVIHRDLKPDNILLAADGRAIITDFGIARAIDEMSTTQSGVMVGTPAYMAPEQLDGYSEVDERTDIFSLGVVLYELATGERPWTGASAMAVAVAMATKPARDLGALRPGAPPGFASTVMRCLSRAPDDRPSTAEEVAAGLRADPGAAPVALAPRPLPASGTAIAVLALECEEEDEYLALGLGDELADLLGRAPGIRVRFVTSWVGLSSDPRDTGAKLGVQHVLTGALRRREGGGLRVSLRLANTSDGFMVWSDRAECDHGDVLALGERFANGIARTLSTSAVRSTRPTDPRAADLYLRGRAELRRFWGEHLVAAVDLLDEAARLAPDSVQICAALADACVQAWNMTELPRMRALAASAVDRALAADPSVRTARLASAAFRLGTGDIERGAYDVGIALAGSPTSAAAHEAAARLLFELGEPDEARARFATALGLEPSHSAQLSAELAWLDGFQRMEASAEARLAAVAADADPALQGMARVYQCRLAIWYKRMPALRQVYAKLDGSAEPIGRALHAGFAPALASGAIDWPAWCALRAWVLDKARPWRPVQFALEWSAEMAMVFDRRDLALDCATQLVAHGSADTYWFDESPSLAPMESNHDLARLRATVRGRARAALYAYRAGLRA